MQKFRNLETVTALTLGSAPVGAIMAGESVQ